MNKQRKTALIAALLSVFILSGLRPAARAAGATLVDGSFADLKNALAAANAGETVTVSGEYELSHILEIPAGVTLAGPAVFRPASDFHYLTGQVYEGFLVKAYGGSVIRDITFTGILPANAHVILADGERPEGNGSNVVTLERVSVADISLSDALDRDNYPIGLVAYSGKTIVSACTFSRIARVCIYAHPGPGRTGAEVLVTGSTFTGISGSATAQIGILADANSRVDIVNSSFSDFGRFEHDASGRFSSGVYGLPGAVISVTDCTFSSPDPFWDYDITLDGGCRLTINGNLDAHSIWSKGDTSGQKGDGWAEIVDNTGRWVLVRDGDTSSYYQYFPDVRSKISFAIGTSHPGDIQTDSQTVDITLTAGTAFSGSDDFSISGLRITGLILEYSLNGAPSVSVPLTGFSGEQVQLSLYGLTAGAYTANIRLLNHGVPVAETSTSFTVTSTYVSPSSPSIPPTGDHSPVIWLVIALSASLGLLLFLLLRRKRRQ